MVISPPTVTLAASATAVGWRFGSRFTVTVPVADEDDNCVPPASTVVIV